MTVIIDEKKCSACGSCIDSCPVEALSIKGGVLTVEDNCVDCGACISECTLGALSL
jgi:NAD-dependent dihydropyrimidine dehydrogenase PreA subunit